VLFKKNINQKGRLLRFAVAILLLVYAIWQHSWIAFALAVFTLLEAAFSWCVFYQLMGWNSCPIHNLPKDGVERKQKYDKK
jgi:hypothetical protein